MSVHIASMIWKCDFPTVSAKIIALKLADCANDDGENIYPSAARLERETGCSTSTVREVLALLEAQGLLVVVSESHTNRHGHSSTIRRYDLDVLEGLLSKRLVWRYETRALIDEETNEPQRMPSGKARVERLWRIERADGLPPPDSGPLQNLDPPESGAHPSRIAVPPCTPYKDKPSLNRHTHSARVREVDGIVDELISAKPDREALVRQLVEPIIRQRSFSAPDPVYALGEIADREDVRSLDAATIAKAVAFVLERRAAVVKPHDIQVAIAEAATAARRAKTDQQRESAAMAAAKLRKVRVEHGDPRFDAEVQRWLSIDPKRASAMQSRGYVVLTEGGTA